MARTEPLYDSGEWFRAREVVQSRREPRPLWQVGRVLRKGAVFVLVDRGIPQRVPKMMPPHVIAVCHSPPPHFFRVAQTLVLRSDPGATSCRRPNLFVDDVCA